MIKSIQINRLRSQILLEIKNMPFPGTKELYIEYLDFDCNFAQAILIVIV